MEESGLKMAPPNAKKRCGAMNLLQIIELMLRVMALLCCIVACVVLATAKQSKVIQIPGFTNLSITKTAKFDLAKAFVYLVSAAGIGAVYSILAMIVSLASAERPGGGAAMAWFLFVFDQIMTYVLLAAAAASAEVAVLGAHAPPELSWLKICTLFGRFCNQLGASLVASFVATLIFAFSSAISAYHLFNKKASAVASKG